MHKFDQDFQSLVGWWETASFMETAQSDGYIQEARKEYGLQLPTS